MSQYGEQTTKHRVWGKLVFKAWYRDLIIQSGTQKPSMGDSQCQMMRNTGQNTNDIMFDGGGHWPDAFVLTDCTL